MGRLPFDLLHYLEYLERVLIESLSSNVLHREGMAVLEEGECEGKVANRALDVKFGAVNDANLEFAYSLILEEFAGN